jgi:hypothetical protein
VVYFGHPSAGCTISEECQKSTFEVWQAARPLTGQKLSRSKEQFHFDQRLIRHLFGQKVARSSNSKSTTPSQIFSLRSAFRFRGVVWSLSELLRALNHGDPDPAPAPRRKRAKRYRIVR